MTKIEKYILKKDLKDASGMTMSKGQVVYEFGTLKNPMTKRELSLLYIDNGTGYPDLMPKTAYDTLELRKASKRAEILKGELLKKVV